MYVVYSCGTAERELKRLVDSEGLSNSLERLCIYLESEQYVYESASWRPALWLLQGILLNQKGGEKSDRNAIDKISQCVNYFLTIKVLSIRERAELLAHFSRLIKFFRKQKPAILDDRLVSVYNFGLERLVSERERLKSIFADHNSHMNHNIVQHRVGNSGFFSEIEGLVASCLTASMMGSELDVDLSNSIYRESEYFRSCIKSLRSHGWLSELGHSRHKTDSVSAKKYISALRCLGHLEYMSQSTEISHIKRNIYKCHIVPSLKKVYSEEEIENSGNREGLCEHQYNAKDNRNELSIFFRGGDKTENESLLCRPMDVLIYLFRSYCIEQDRTIPVEITVISDDHTLALDAGRHLSRGCTYISPPKNTEGGYQHKQFMALSSKNRYTLETRIVRSFLRLASSHSITGDPSSNLMNASIYASSGNYIDLPLWGSYPQICF